jgi:hypothetical protein
MDIPDISLILPISKGREGQASLLYSLLNFTFCEYQLSVLLYPIFWVSSGFNTLEGCIANRAGGWATQTRTVGGVSGSCSARHTAAGITTHV